MIDPSFFTRRFFNDPYFEAMFGMMGLAIQDWGYDMGFFFKRLRRTMGEVSKEMHEPTDRKIELTEELIEAQIRESFVKGS